MKILIISDTHRHNENLEIVLKRVRPIDMLIHLGDVEGSEEYIEYLADCTVVMLAGNNDFFSKSPKELIINIGKYNALLAHGHLYNVGFGVERILKKAKEKTIDIVMFGHTHTPEITWHSGLVLLNPGSLSYPRQKNKNPSYIIMDIDGKGEAHYTLNYLNH